MKSSSKLKIVSVVITFQTILSGCGISTSSSDKEIGHNAEKTNPLLTQGQDRGNGAEDNLPPHVGGAWFVGPEKTVRYCIEVDKDFFRLDEQLLLDSSSEARTFFAIRFAQIRNSPPKVVREAIDKWVNWVNASGAYYYHKRRLATHFIEVPCQPGVDLKFYFGHETPEIESARREMRHPLAFAYETEVDYKLGWRKGYIWVSRAGSHPLDFPHRFFPNWSEEDQLFAIVLHEIGHVFGVDHTEGTIMDADILGRIAGATEPASYLDKETKKIRRASLRQINQQRMVLFPLDIFFEIHGQLGARILNPKPGEKYPTASALAVFEELMGRKAQGDIQAILSGTDAYSLTLKIQDDMSSHDFPIQVRFLGDDRIQIFGRGRGAYIYQDGGPTSTTGSYGEVYSGIIQTALGNKKEVIIQANPFNPNSYDMGPFRLTLVGPDMTATTLFRAGLIY